MDGGVKMKEFSGLVTGVGMFLIGLWITVLVAVPHFSVLVRRSWGIVEEVPVEIALALLLSNLCWAVVCLYVGFMMGGKT